jgi:hypothetical protein
VKSRLFRGSGLLFTMRVRQRRARRVCPENLPVAGSKGPDKRAMPASGRPLHTSGTRLGPSGTRTLACLPQAARRRGAGLDAGSSEPPPSHRPGPSLCRSGLQPRQKNRCREAAYLSRCISREFSSSATAPSTPRPRATIFRISRSEITVRRVRQENHSPPAQKKPVPNLSITIRTGLVQISCSSY